MRTSQLSFRPDGGWADDAQGSRKLLSAQLVLAFGDRALVERADVVDHLRDRFPDARLVLCSSGGEIAGESVLDDSVVATALEFDHTRIRAAACDLRCAEESFAAGQQLAQSLVGDDLRHVLVFAEGLRVNGSALANGLASGLPEGVTVTGGLAADGERFDRTVVGLDDRPAPGQAVAVGLYGDRLVVGMGSLGGWEPFGPEHTITRSSENVLIELDGQPALPIYKQLIGAHAYGLPATGLLYPLHVRGAGEGGGVVRTLLAVDQEAGSLTLAGDVPEGRRVRLMRANLDRLIDAAGGAARRSAPLRGGARPDFVLLVSCIGRKLLLQRRVHEELASARTVFGPSATFAGFYSYGELSPLTPAARCELHNQTMTITTLGER